MPSGVPAGHQVSVRIKHNVRKQKRRRKEREERETAAMHSLQHVKHSSGNLTKKGEGTGENGNSDEESEKIESDYLHTSSTTANVLVTYINYTRAMHRRLKREQAGRRRHHERGEGEGGDNGRFGHP